MKQIRHRTSLLQRKNMKRNPAPIGNLGSFMLNRNLNLCHVHWTFISRGLYFRQLRFVNVCKQSSQNARVLDFFCTLTLCFHIRLYEANDEKNPFNDPDYSTARSRKFLLKIPLTAGQIRSTLVRTSFRVTEIFSLEQKGTNQR